MVHRCTARDVLGRINDMSSTRTAKVGRPSEKRTYCIFNEDNKLKKNEEMVCSRENSFAHFSNVIIKRGLDKSSKSVIQNN